MVVDVDCAVYAAVRLDELGARLDVGRTLRSHLLLYAAPARNLECVPAIVKFIALENAFEGLALDLGVFDSTHNGL